MSESIKQVDFTTYTNVLELNAETFITYPKNTKFQILSHFIFNIVL